MDFLLDTNILVHFVRNDTYIRQVEQQFSLFAPENATFISIVSVGEIRSLAFLFGWGKAKLERMNLFLQALRPFPIDREDLAAAYADIDAYSQCYHPIFPSPASQTSRNMGKNDLWIAATAMLLNATLLTTDTDFTHLSPQFLQVEILKF